MGRVSFGLVWLLLVCVSCAPPLTQSECKKSLECKRKGLCSLLDERCIAASDEACKASKFCADLGLCTLRGERCIAASNADCRNATQCQLSNRCLAVAGECIELSVGYCRITNPTCQSEGLCSLDRKNQRCVARRDVDCRNSAVCREQGLCSVDGERGTCVVKSPADCRLHVCEKEGRCGVKGLGVSRICVPRSQADCLASQGCQEGKQLDTFCAFDPIQLRCAKPKDYCPSPRNASCRLQGQCRWNSTLRLCTAANAADCAKSETCKRDGKCTAHHGECVNSLDEACQASPFCALYGDCHSDDKQGDLCLPNTDWDCQNSYECWSHGRCRLSDDHCSFAGCTLPCRQLGRCKEVPGTNTDQSRCVARGSQDCAASEVCKRWGLCLFDARSQQCVFGGDCKGPCRIAGRCRAGVSSIVFPYTSIAMCIATSSKECQESVLCREQGLCRLHAATSRCVALESCALSSACRQFGACGKRTWLDREICAPTEDKHCKESEGCRQNGRCFFEHDQFGRRCVASPAATRTCVGGECDKHCLQESCWRFGRCQFSASTNSCVVGTNLHCTRSVGCRESGLCEKEGNACKGSVCATSAACSFHGHCQEGQREQKRVCLPGSDDHCRKSQACQEFGLCEKSADQCVAGSHSDCKASVACKETGRCSASLGQCIANDCQNADVCSERGLCEAATDATKCIAKSDALCAASEVCRLYGWCRKQGDSCVFGQANGMPCQEACQEFGRCRRGSVAGQVGCVAGTDQDCAKSTVCAELGRCTARQGACAAVAADCAKSPLCGLYGLCKQKGGVCVPTSAEDCRKSLLCRIQGRCLFRAGAPYCLFEKGACAGTPCTHFGRCQRSGKSEANTKCVADDSDQCQASLGCRERGHCFAKGEGCVGAFSAAPGACPTTCKLPNCQRKPGCQGDDCCFIPDCRQHSSCIVAGGCSQQNASLFGYREVVGCYPQSSLDCRSGLVCKEKGLCLYQGTYRVCIAGSDTDCEASRACRERGECKANPIGATRSTNATPGSCYASAQQHCTKSDFCTTYGLCALANGTCQATDTSCKASTLCRRYGRCKSKRFQVSALQALKRSGKAGLDRQLKLYLLDLLASAATGQVGLCVAFSTADCEASLGCDNEGFCGLDFVQQQCTDCSQSRACLDDGRCSEDNGRCIADSEADCKRSRGCRTQNRCRLDAATGRCVP